jgi:hypothetical protein
MYREIGFMEFYRLARRAKLNPFSSTFVALVWVLRRDKILVDE